MDKLTQAFHFRHACKKFDQTKKIKTEDIHFILEAGRLSPSSFGMEPWHFAVIDKDEIKELLQPMCYNQKQVTSCSHFVVILYRKAKQFTRESEYLRSTIARFLPDPNDENTLIAECDSFFQFSKSGLAKGLTLDHWSEMQCYIASANMLTASAYLGIDSCAIGGFQSDNVLSVLAASMPKFNSEDFGVALCLSFGYRLTEPEKRIRWPLADVATFL